jgi:NADH:ubiquinone oxidoreductase 24 kD subunit
MENKIDYAKADEILSSYGKDASYLIAIMQDIQSEYKYLPVEILEHVAHELDVSVAKVYSVATFYENFSLEPKGKHVIRICDGTACHVRKSIPILNKLREELGLSDKKHTTDNMEFTLETVSCLGACGLAPVLTLDDVVHPAMTPEKAIELLSDVRKEDAAHE